VPPIGNGTGLTLTTAVVMQPVPSAYVIILVPLVIPQNRPEVVLMVPTAGLLLVQVPPGDELVNGVHWPSQAFNVPLIVPGSAYTVTSAVIRQVVGNV
jgi:hypothetical protein